MLKRILFIVSALVLLVCFFAFPVSADNADDADDDLPYVELMDYVLSPVDGTIPGTFYVMDSYDFSCYFMGTLGEICGYGYEITYSYTGNLPSVTGVSFGGVSDPEFVSRSIDGTNIGKIRGSFDGTVGGEFGISFSSSGCYITVHSFRLFLVEDFYVDLPSVLYGNGNRIDVAAGDSGVISNTGSCSVEIDNWRNFDIVNIRAFLGGYGVTSVSAALVENAVSPGTSIIIPFEINYINLSAYDVGHEDVLLAMSCDLRGVDPATVPDSTLIISFTFSLPAGSYGYLQLLDCYGSVFFASPDEYLPWLKLMYITLNSIDANTQQAAFYVNAIYSFLYDRILPAISSINDTLNGNFSSLQEFLNNHWVTSFEDLTDFWTQIEQSKWSLLHPQLKEIILRLEDLVSGTPVDQTVTDNMTAAGDQLSGLGQQISAGTPQVNTDGNISLGSVPDDGSGVLASSLFNFFWSSDYVISMLMTVVGIATLGYVFFGKKG